MRNSANNPYNNGILGVVIKSYSETNFKNPLSFLL